MIRNLKALGLAFVAVFAMSAMAASAANGAAAHFTTNSPTGNAIITAHQDETEPHQKFTTEWGTVDCSMFDGKGTLAANTNTDLTLNKSTVGNEPRFYGRTGANTNNPPCSFLGLAATIELMGCDFLFHAGTKTVTGSTGTVDLKCPETTGPTIIVAGCKITVHPKDGLGPVTYTNVDTGGGAKKEVTANVEIATGIPYTSEGANCPGNATNTTTDGKYEGRAVVKAYEELAGGAEGNQVNAEITST